MDFAIDTHDGVTMVTPATDRLDAETAITFKERFLDLIGHGAQDIVVNLKHVTFIDSTGLGVLVAGLKKLNGAGRILLCNLHPTVQAVLRVTRLTHVFPVFETEHEAWESLQY